MGNWNIVISSELSASALSRVMLAILVLYCFPLRDGGMVVRSRSDVVERANAKMSSFMNVAVY